jgi:hypothetical protein
MKEVGRNEVEARRINAEPWEPLPGYHKVRCHECLFWFAAPNLRTTTCPDCQLLLKRIARRMAAANNVGQ